MQETSWVGKIHRRRDRQPTPIFLGFSGGSVGKESTCSAVDLGSIPGLGRPLEQGTGYPLQYSGVENSMDYIIHGVEKSWTQLNNFHFHFSNTSSTLNPEQSFRIPQYPSLHCLSHHPQFPVSIKEARSLRFQRDCPASFPALLLSSPTLHDPIFKDSGHHTLTISWLRYLALTFPYALSFLI